MTKSTSRKKLVARKRIWLLLTVALAILICSFPELTYKNTGVSQSSGTVGNGSLANAHLLPYSGPNWRYFSPLSYFMLDDAYTNSRVVSTLEDAFKALEDSRPHTKWRVMECGREEGGKTLIHKTHQSGLSVDLMVPKKNSTEDQVRRYDWLGMWHYLLEFSDDGKLNFDQSTQIDFEGIGALVLALDDASKKNGLRIKMVILKIELKDDFYATPSGNEVKRRGIYLAQSLPEWTNRVHDDHIHVDFARR